MTDLVKAADLRKWAERCLARIQDTRCGPEERERLVRMRASLLHLAENADWLNGERSGGPSAAPDASHCVN